MAAAFRFRKDDPPPRRLPDDPDRFPSNAELLHELRKHGAKPPPRPPPRMLSRRTRDYFLIAGLGSGAIAFAVFRLLANSDPGNAVRLALTAIAVFVGLLAFVFYGVMSRY